LLLLLCARQQDRQRAQLLHAQEQRGGGAGLGQLFDGHEDADLAGAEAAICLGERHGQDVLLGEQLFHVPGELAFGVDLGGARCDLVAHELADDIQQHLFFGG